MTILFRYVGKKNSNNFYVKTLFSSVDNYKNFNAKITDICKKNMFKFFI